MEMNCITQAEALEIYERKLYLMKTIREEIPRTKAARLRKECILLATQYRVSLRSIREVWNRRTWVVCTSTLWEEEGAELLLY
jgi:hypothetical protein